MKKFSAVFAIFCVFFMVSCVNEDADPIVIGNNVCSYGEYECHDGNSYYCGYPDSSNDVMWIHAETCHNGCDSSTGKCYRNSGGSNNNESGNNSGNNNESGNNGSGTGNSGNDDPSECTSGNFKCVGDESHYCNSFGSWVYDARCEYGCNSSTGKCKTNSGNSEDPTTNQTCADEGSYRCYGNLRQQCYSGAWKTVEECEYECNTTTSKCEIKIECTTVDGKTWTDKTELDMALHDAKDYCDNLTECGHSDWHLPTISELRTLIQNCPATMTDGECGVTDTCSIGCWNEDACLGCDYDSSGKYSKLGDTLWFWSSSLAGYDNNPSWYWRVNFCDGHLGSGYESNKYSVRCVR